MSLFGYASFISIRTTESNSQGSRVGCLGKTAVRTRLQACIPGHNAERSSPVQTDKKRSKRNENRGQARGNVIRHVVQPSCRPPKIPIAVVFVANHRVECLDGFVRQR